MALSVIYSVYDKNTGDLLVIGTARECAAKFGISEQTFKNGAEDTSSDRRWDVRKSEPVSGETAAAIRSWEAFCAPLRKKYNIPVWKGNPKEE